MELVKPIAQRAPPGGQEMRTAAWNILRGLLVVSTLCVHPVICLAQETTLGGSIVDESKGAEVFYLPYDKTLVELGHLLADAQIGKILGAWKLPFLLKKRADRLKKFFSGK